MEINGYNPRTHLINEITQGRELAMQLRGQMGPEYCSAQTNQILLQQIVSSYERALSILRRDQPHQLALVTSPLLPSSPGSIKGSDQTARSNSHQDVKECSLKRKSASTWTNQVKLNPVNGLDGPPPDDGYSWRKYGQKDILGAKHPRSYYRCTYRNLQDCWATKQVQRSDKDPTVLDITYRGKHTCDVVRRSKSAPTLPTKRPKQEDLLIEEYQQDSSMVSSFQATPPLEIADMQNIDSFPLTALDCIKSESPTFYGHFPTCLISQSTTDSNYFSLSPSNLDTFANQQQQYFEGGIADIFLGATTSSTNSTTIEPSFSLDAWSFNPNATPDSGSHRYNFL